MRSGRFLFAQESPADHGVPRRSLSDLDPAISPFYNRVSDDGVLASSRGVFHRRGNAGDKRYLRVRGCVAALRR